MKKLAVLILVLASVGMIEAQVDRSKAPKAAPAREIKIGNYQSFALKNGLQIFVVENHKLPRVQFSLQLKNDPIMETTKVGYVEMAGDLLATGTATRTKAQLDEEVDYIGAVLNTSWNGIFASSLTKHRDKLLELFTDVLYNPAFSPEEMDKLKTQTLSGLAASKDDPNSIASNVRAALVYGKNHTYGEIQTEKTVESITLDDCKNYFKTYFKPNNAYLVIVGDIDLKTAKATAEKYFAKWTTGEVKNPVYGQPQPPSKTYVALVDRPNSVQSVINISYPISLRTGSQEAIKARVLNQILGGSFSSRLMQNLREKHGYTYGARSVLESDFLVGNFNATASVRNEVTDSSVYEFMAELKRIVNEPVTEGELIAAKAAIAGAFGRSLESPQTIASFAVNTAKYNLPKDYYANYLKSIDAVTTSDVQAIAKLLIRPDNAHIVVVGKGSDIEDKLKNFGEVKHFDIYGEPFVPVKTGAMPAGLTVEKVLSSYIEAVGGLKKVEEVKTSKVVMTATVQGQTLKLTETKKSPNMSVEEMSFGGQVMNSSVSNGKDVVVKAMGQKQPLDGKTKEAQIFGGYSFRELEYASMGGKAELKAVEKLEGKDAYVVEFVLPLGSKVTDYYDAQSGLKLQTIIINDSPQGQQVVTVAYSDYREVNGVKFPHKVTTTGAAPFPLNFVVESFEINGKVDDSIFMVE